MSHRQRFLAKSKFLTIPVFPGASNAGAWVELCGDLVRRHADEVSERHLRENVA